MERNCDHCGEAYWAKSPRSRFCSDRCRKRASRHPKTENIAPDIDELVPLGEVLDGADEPDFSLLAATLKVLQEANVVEHPGGQAALLLARRLERSTLDTGSSIAALVREHSRSLTFALAAGEVEDDPSRRTR